MSALPINNDPPMSLLFFYDEEAKAYYETDSSITHRIALATGFADHRIENIGHTTYTGFKNDSYDFEIKLCKTCQFYVFGRCYLINLENGNLEVITDPTKEGE